MAVTTASARESWPAPGHGLSAGAPTAAPDDDGLDAGDPAAPAASRFTHLLQPIRDLAENWCIDIARELEDYVAEVAQICVSFDGGATTLNFAEAALLIQGSTCIYSKKVRRARTLPPRPSDMIACRRRMPLLARRTRRCACVRYRRRMLTGCASSAAAPKIPSCADQIEYLYALVYQVLDMITAKRRNARAQQSSLDVEGHDADAQFEPTDEDAFLSLDDMQPCVNIELDEAPFGEADHDRRASAARPPPSRNMASALNLPRTPLALMSYNAPASDPAGAANADDIGRSRVDAIVSERGEAVGSRFDYRMNTSHIHASGALLLDGASCHMVASATKQADSVRRTLRPGSGLDDDDDDDDEGNNDNGNGGGELGGGDAGMGVGPADLGQSGDLVFGGDATDFSHLAAAGNPAPVAGLAAQRSGGGTARDAEDPWRPLDPHDVVPVPVRRFRKGKPYRLPPSLVHEGGDAARGPLTPISVFCAAPARPVPTTGCRALSNREFDYLYWPIQKRELERRRQERAAAPAPAADAHGGDSDGDTLGLWGTALDLGDAADQPLAEDPDFDNASDDAVGDAAGNAGIDGAVGGITEGIEFGTEGVTTSVAELPSTAAVECAMSYEDLVRQHMDAYYTSAQLYAQETSLSRRVQEWETRIKPLLEEEENRPPFDIHTSTGHVIQHLSRLADGSRGSAPVLPFQELASDRPRFEVCRLFVSCLQLVRHPATTTSAAAAAAAAAAATTITNRLMRGRCNAGEQWQRFVAGPRVAGHRG